jgi:arginine deiminase
MWNVKSESGKLRSVLVHTCGFSQWWKIPIPGTNPLSERINLKQTYPIETAAMEHKKILDFMKQEKVKVFELDQVLTEILREASLKEKNEIIKQVWGEEKNRPKPEEVKAEHLVNGFPSKPYFDEKKDSFFLPEKQRGSIYTRDISFMTPAGLIISKMKYESRWEQPKIAKIAFNYHPQLREKVNILFDINEIEEEIDSSSPWIEGGDVLIVDEDMILCGVGQRTNLLGLKYTMEKIFENDIDEKISTICAVRIPGPLPCGGHLDVFINFPDKRKALVMPYILDSSLVPGFPNHKLLKKLNEKLVSLPKLKRRLGVNLALANFDKSGMCDVYRRDKTNKPVKIAREENLIDFLIKQNKIDVDSIILTGGVPDKENDVDHMFRALQEGLREATNIVTIKPGLIIAYERNWATNENLKENGIKIRELPTSHLDMLGGPHCMTMPLQRD